MNGNEIGIIVATIGVIVGCALEGWEHLDDIKRRGWKPLIPKIGFSILLISLAVEIVFDARLADESANTQLEAAKIEQRLAWRHFSKEQVAELSKLLAPARGQTVSVAAQMSDPEASEFARQI